MSRLPSGTLFALTLLISCKAVVWTVVGVPHSESAEGCIPTCQALQRGPDDYFECLRACPGSSVIDDAHCPDSRLKPGDDCADVPLEKTVAPPTSLFAALTAAVVTALGVAAAFVFAHH